jgi:hypothetical protein
MHLHSDHKILFLVAVGICGLLLLIVLTSCGHGTVVPEAVVIVEKSAYPDPVQPPKKPAKFSIARMEFCVADKI